LTARRPAQRREPPLQPRGAHPCVAPATWDANALECLLTLLFILVQIWSGIKRGVKRDCSEATAGARLRRQLTSRPTCESARTRCSGHFDFSEERACLSSPRVEVE
jgi:hypothetical protein